MRDFQALGFDALGSKKQKNGKLERFAESKEQYEDLKQLFEECSEKHPFLLAKLADGNIRLEKFRNLIEKFDHYPEAIMRILGGEDEDAIAVEFDLLQI